jgi:hypothetical protein
MAPSAIESLDKTVFAAMECGDYQAAETGVRQMIALQPASTVYSFKLGQVLEKEGKPTEAQAAYRVYVRDPKNSNTDFVFLTHFGELSTEVKAVDDASLAYARVVDLKPSMFPAEICPRSEDLDSAQSLRATALAEEASFYRGDPDKYLKQASSAYAVSRKPYFPHLVMADTLYVNGRLADSWDEFLAAERLAPDRAKQISAYVDTMYSFKNWDHVSVGVIGKGGKVTITYKKVKLPNNLNWAGRPVAKAPISPRP